nr:aminotransferase class V-fold PLP-dependent enzyme [uncultured Lichenicoccus sp.]
MNIVSNELFTLFDANASESPRQPALDAAAAATRLAGNPASVHRAGRAARAVLEAARERLAELFGADADDIVFTSGGTEADALALHGIERVVLYGATEHDAVRNAVPGHARAVAVRPDGRLDPQTLATALAATPGPALVCLMLANNETGVLHPVSAAAQVCRAHGAWLHVDAVQAAGRIPLDLRALGADSMALSGHKLGGPKGAGALLLGGARRGPLPPLISGGGQEQGRRGGTPALPAIAGFAAAAADAVAGMAQAAFTQGRLRDRIERAAIEVGAIACGAASPRLPNTTCLALPGRAAATQLIALDIAGYGVSAGSACSSGKVARSHVLDAMGLGPLAGQAIRVSLPWNVEAASVEGFIAAYVGMATRRIPAGSGQAA